MPMPHDARHALLARLFDHAPLFPPASLPLEDALEEDARALRSPQSWILGRFVSPASLLSELPRRERRISAVLDVPLRAGAEVESVEARFGEDVQALARLGVETYVEVPLDDALEERLAEIAALGLRAKVRCGGSEVPSVESLAWCLRACRETGVVCKATAGLHHAVRGAREHGFLNVLAAVVFGDEEAALADEDRDAFGLDADAFSWRGLAANVPQLRAARSERLAAIGSCSFFEPIGELEALGMLA